MAAPHLDVAERFRFFLRSVGLSREGFADAVDGAVEAHSLFSVLNGHRRPSRALAVLIERSWGLRADFLLHGTGEMWTKPAYAAPSIGGAALSPGEAAVVDFMRASVDNARAMEGQLEQAWLWARLSQRLEELVADLDACASASEADRRAYPLFARLVFADLDFMAEQHEQLTALLHRRRVHQLTDRLLQHSIRARVGELLGPKEREQADSLLDPLVERRMEALEALEESIRRVRATIDRICQLGPVTARVRSHDGSTSLERRRELVGRLAELAPEELGDEVSSLAAELETDADPKQVIWTRLQRVLRDLLDEIRESRSAVADAYTVEELQARYDGLLEPLAG